MTKTRCKEIAKEFGLPWSEALMRAMMKVAYQPDKVRLR